MVGDSSTAERARVGGSGGFSLKAAKEIRQWRHVEIDRTFTDYGDQRHGSGDAAQAVKERVQIGNGVV